MNYIKIHGNTYLINGPTNIGVYAFKSKQTILIDTGINNTYARRIQKILDENRLKAKYIFNTHHHEDHTGGNKYFKENNNGIVIYSSYLCKVLCENRFLDSAMLFGGNPIKPIFSKGNSINIDNILLEGTLKIDEEKFIVHTLKGHAESGIGVSTPDKVCFIGDSLFSREILEKYSFPFLYDIEDTLSTLNYLKSINDEYFVLGHCKKVLSKEELIDLVDYNYNKIIMYKEQIKEILEVPVSKEEILQNLCILNDLDLNPKQYYLNMFTVSAYLKQFDDERLLKYSVEDGKLYFYLN